LQPAGTRVFVALIRSAYRHHRFWAQVDAALANAEYDLLFARP